jgi:mono/diheme cytochrome c family protein
MSTNVDNLFVPWKLITSCITFMPRRTFVLLLTFAGTLLAAEVPAAYTAQCSNCHGVDGRGKTTAKMEIADLHSKAVQDLSDSDLYESIARGTKHHAYPHAYLYRGMKEKEIRALVQYIRSFAPTAAK